MAENRIEKTERENLLVCGISHHSASLAEREQLQVNRHELPKALKTFMSIQGVTEVAILSTCNRFEIYFCTTKNDRAIDILYRFYRKFRKLDIRPLEHLFYTKHASSVVRHLCRVASAMDSLVLGETQIIGQVRQAYSLACSLKTPGKILHKAFHAAFRAGKAVRSETAIGEGQRSVAGEAVAILREKVPPEAIILIIGVNQNTKLAAKCLYGAGYHNLMFANRTKYKAEKLAAQFDAEGCSLDGIQGKLNQCQVLISCTGAPDYIISADQVAKRLEIKDGSFFIVDMAVPRDVDTTGISDKNLQVIDLQDLKNYLELQNLQRKAQFPLAEQLIEREVNMFQAWLESCEDPMLSNIAEEFEQIRQKKLAELTIDLPPEEQRKMDDFSRKLVRQMLSVPKKYLATEQNREKQ